MFNWRTNHGLRAAIATAGLGVAFALPLGATAAQAAVTQQQASQFKANPQSALPQLANGARPTAAQLAALTALVRDLMATDPSTLNSIIGLLTGADEAEQRAIGRGLAQAALAVVGTNRDLADQIQQAIAASNVLAAINAYAEATGNVLTASSGGGGGGGGPTGQGSPGGGGGGGRGGPGGGNNQGNGGGGGLTGGNVNGGGNNQGQNNNNQGRGENEVSDH